jgi:hypothetical protein
MSEDAAQRPVVIFLSYRRGDTQWAARGIYDRLVDRYGRRNVFRDLDAIPPGARFRDYVEKKISESDVLILLIGKAWASYADEMGRRRLEQPRDPVRLEVEAALRLGLPIIPVRVEGAPMPTEGDLVPSIVDLLEFNAAEVSDSRWEYDVERLLWAINETVEGRLRPSAPKSAGDREAEEQARREAEEQARRDADERARREAEEQARRDGEEQARRNKDEAERQVHPRPVGKRPTLVTELSPLEAAEQIRTRSRGTARNLLRQRAVIIATTVGIGGVAVLVAHFMLARPVATIMGHLPNDLRASCATTTDKAAICHLNDGTVVFFRLFDTATEAKTAVMNGQEIAPASQPCPPSAPSVNTSVVCRYTVGPEKGLAMFGYTAKDVHRYYVSRWVPDAEPLLRGEMSTENANPLDWTTLETNWTRLARTR